MPSREKREFLKYAQKSHRTQWEKLLTFLTEEEQLLCEWDKYQPDLLSNNEGAPRKGKHQGARWCSFCRVSGHSRRDCSTMAEQASTMQGGKANPPQAC